MKNKCDVCEGTGEINSHPYRESSQQTNGEKILETGIWTSLKDFIVRIRLVRGLMTIVIIFGIFFGVKYLFKFLDAKDKEHELKLDHERSLIVQYNDTGKFVRCFVIPQTKQTPLSDHYTRVNISGLHPDQSELTSMGAPEDAKCSYLH